MWNFSAEIGCYSGGDGVSGAFQTQIDLSTKV